MSNSKYAGEFEIVLEKKNEKTDPIRNSRLRLGFLGEEGEDGIRKLKRDLHLPLLQKSTAS